MFDRMIYQLTKFAMRTPGTLPEDFPAKLWTVYRSLASHEEYRRQRFNLEQCLGAADAAKLESLLSEFSAAVASFLVDVCLFFCRHQCLTATHPEADAASVRDALVEWRLVRDRLARLQLAAVYIVSKLNVVATHYRTVRTECSKVMSPAQLAEVFDCTPKTITNRIKRGALDVVKLSNRRLRVRRDQLPGNH